MKNNPYNFTRPVTDPSMFFGRWDLVDRLLLGMTTGSPCSYSIYGGRRSGKTSLIRMVERKLNERLDQENQSVVIPLYIDLQFDPPSSIGDFFSRLINRLVEWQSGAIGAFDPLPSIDDNHPARSFSDAFCELYNRACDTVGGINLALLVDESENLNRPDWARGLEDNLRALLSNVPGVSGHLGLVMTGGVDFYNDMATHTGGSPLRNVLDEEIILQPCDFEEMLRMINEPSGGFLREEIAMEVTKYAGGNLFLGQYIMKHLWDYDVENITLEDVMEIALGFQEKRRDYDSWTDAIGEDDLKIYEVLSRNNRLMSFKEIGKATTKNRLEIKVALDKLIMHNLVARDGGKFKFSGEMFRDWFIENIPGSIGKTIKVFISYAHEDEVLCETLKKHLSNLKRQGIVSAWYDRKIIPGQRWAQEINEQINNAQVIIFLVSADFMSSAYCNDIEVMRAMERHEAGEAIVIPVVLRPTDWSGAPFSKLQALPKDAKPITEWANRDRAFLDVVKGVRATIETLEK